jgi:hypothetical protein
VTEEVTAAEAPAKIAPPAPVVAHVAPPDSPPKKKDNKKKEKDKVKEEVAENQVSTDEDDQQSKPELDEGTLKKLPQLPPGISPGMWRLYPDLVSNGGVVPQGPPTLQGGAPLAQSATTAQPGLPPQSAYAQDPPPQPKGVVGLPTLPPDIDPRMGTIYPWNLMQTIGGPITYPNLQLPPMALPIGVAGSHP